VFIGLRTFSIMLEWRELFRRPMATLLKPGYMLHGGLAGAIAMPITNETHKDANVRILEILQWGFRCETLPARRGLRQPKRATEVAGGRDSSLRRHPGGVGKARQRQGLGRVDPRPGFNVVPDASSSRVFTL